MPILEGYSSTTSEDLKRFKDTSSQWVRRIKECVLKGKREELEEQLASLGIVIALRTDSSSKKQKEATVRIQGCCKKINFRVSKTKK